MKTVKNAKRHAVPRVLFNSVLSVVLSFWGVSTFPQVAWAQQPVTIQSGGASVPVAVNLLKPLTDSAAWTLYTAAPASAASTIEGNALKVTIREAGTANWHVQVNHKVAGIEEGKLYILTGRVRADRALPVTIYATTKSAAARNIGVAQTVKATTEWQPFYHRFRARGIVGQDCVLQLLMGQGAATIWWSDLELRAETSGEAAYREAATEATALKGRWPLDQYRTYPGVPSVRQRYFIAPLRFANTRDKFVEPKEYFNRLFSNEWPGMGHYWRSVSYGKLDVEGEAVDWIDLPGYWQDYCTINNGLKQYSTQKLADEIAKRYSLRDFDAIALFPNMGDETGYAGAISVTVQGKVYRGIHIPENAVAVGICAHEIGHALGLSHPYGYWSKANNDKWDVMGSGASHGLVHLRFGAIQGETNAYHKMLMGWISDSQILRVGPGTEREFHLERLAEPTQDRYLAAVITPANAGGRFWTLEARMQAGYDKGNIPVEGVVCHECVPNREDPIQYRIKMKLPAVSAPVDTDGNDNVNDAGVAWEVGKTYVNTQYRFSVTVVSRKATGWTVRVKVDP